MKLFNKHRVLFPVATAFIIGGIFFAGFEIGARFGISEISRANDLVNKIEGQPEAVDFSPFWITWNILNEKFVGPGATTTNQMKVYGAISGLAASLGDPYTNFFPPAEKKIFEEDIRGNFDGIGIEIGIKNRQLVVISPLKGNPAAAAGVKAGDVILKINDIISAEMATEEAVKLIRGEKGTPVRLTLLREGVKEPFEVTIVRDTINIPTVDTELRSDGIFIIRLHSFSAVSPNLFRDALREFLNANTNKMIIDLRGNPGGYLEAAVDLASWFLPAGEVVVKEDRGKNGEGQVYRSFGYDIFNNNLKLVILVDGGSASASEIFAGALEEHGKATLVGGRTFGKGSVQELVPITADTSLKVTIARWLTPNGVSISEHGIIPNQEVPVTAEDAAKGIDRQLQKAVEVIKGM